MASKLKDLILAIVVVAILVFAGFLFVIIANPCFGMVGCGEIFRDPNGRAAEAIKTIYSKPGTQYKTTEVGFKKAELLVAKTIAMKSGLLSEEQVCVSLGDFENDSSYFQVQKEGVITYIGLGTKRVELSAICDDGTTLVSEDIPRYQGSYDWASSCPNWKSYCENSSETCCIVALRKA